MSLIQRKARPLVRDSVSLRDDRLFIVACDDTYAPDQYFGFFRLPRIQVHVVPSVDGQSSAEHVLHRLQQIQHEEDDQRWILLDVDHNDEGPHLRAFVATLAKARQAGINVALSKPCFELWLLLHHQDENTVYDLVNARAVETALRATLGEYNKTNLKRQHYPLASVSEARRRAQRLDERVAGGEIPQENTTRVYLLWEAIVSKAIPSQLPSELRKLI